MSKKQKMMIEFFHQQLIDLDDQIYYLQNEITILTNKKNKKEKEKQFLHAISAYMPKVKS